MKRSTEIGIIFIIVYIGMYLSFFIYKITKMIQKEDVTFYDTYAFIGEPPFIQLSKDIFMEDLL